jgi:hypothetical protein
VRLLVDWFKRSSSKLVYHPLLRQHVNKIKTKITHVQQVWHQGPYFRDFRGPEKTKLHSPTSSKEVGGHSWLTIFDCWWAAHDCGCKI